MHQDAIPHAIAEDLQDPEFQRLGARHAGRNARWTLALGKLPNAPQDDLVKCFLKRAPAEGNPTRGRAGLEAGEPPVYDEMRYDEYASIQRHYRYIHATMLGHKIARVRDAPRFASLLGERQRLQVHATRQAAFAALTDAQLGVMPEGMPVARILDFRGTHASELAEARDRLAWMARTIKSDPWSDEFADHVHHDLVPKLEEALRPARRPWRECLKAAGVAVSGVAGVASIAFGAEPLLSVTGVVAAMGAAGGAAAGAIDIADTFGKAPAQANGLHYLLKLRRV